MLVVKIICTINAESILKVMKCVTNKFSHLSLVLVLVFLEASSTANNAFASYKGECMLVGSPHPMFM